MYFFFCLFIFFLLFLLLIVVSLAFAVLRFGSVRSSSCLVSSRVKRFANFFFLLFFFFVFFVLQVMSQLSRFLFVAWIVQLASGLVLLIFLGFFFVKKKSAKLGLALAKAPTALPYLPPASHGQEEEHPSFQTMETESHSTVAVGWLLETEPIQSPRPPTMASHGQDSEQASFPRLAAESPLLRESGWLLAVEQIRLPHPPTE